MQKLRKHFNFIHVCIFYLSHVKFKMYNLPSMYMPQYIRTTGFYYLNLHIFLLIWYVVCIQNSEKIYLMLLLAFYLDFHRWTVNVHLYFRLSTFVKASHHYLQSTVVFKWVHNTQWEQEFAAGEISSER